MKRSAYYKISLVILACWANLLSSAWAGTSTVTIMPFQINAEKDYSFLQKGIVDMLTSRLSSSTVTVVDPASTGKAIQGVQGMTGDSLALMVGAKLKADYIIHGSLTVLNESVSIDAKMLNVTGKRPPLYFFKQTASMNEVIPEINRIATDINAQVFNRKVAGRPAPTVAPAPSVTPSATARTDVHAHPEKLIQNNMAPSDGQDAPFAKKGSQGSGGPLNPGFVTAPGSSAKGADFWKSRNFALMINGIDVGDINGDGLKETVIVTPNEVHIYQFAQGRRKKIKKIDSGRFVYNIGVDVGDINANGRPEIFITSFNNQKDTLNSLVLEFDGQDYKPLVSKARWYFRIVNHPAKGRLLVGQRQKTGGPNPLSSEIVILTWNGGAYVPASRVLPPNRGNALGFAISDIMDDKAETMIAFTAEDRLSVLTPNGKEAWRSSKQYGGSVVTFNLPIEGPGDIENFFYLPIRIRTADLDRNNLSEVIVAKNFDKTGRLLQERRFFKNGHIEALKWDGIGLTTVWKTRQISGRIQDFVVADFNNDGQNDLLAAVVLKEGSLVGTKPKSTLIAYPLNN